MELYGIENSLLQGILADIMWSTKVTQSITSLGQGFHPLDT